MKKLLVLAGLLLGQSAIAQVQPETLTGSIVVGAPTGGNCGTGCVNATALEINGTPVSGGGGTPAFSAVTSGTNTAAAMLVGTGASLGATGSGTLTATAVSLSGVTGLGTGIATFLATPTSANFAAAVTGAIPLSSGGTNSTTGQITATNTSGYTFQNVSGSITTGTTGFGDNFVGTVNDASAVDGIVSFANITCTLCTATTFLTDWKVGGTSEFSLDTNGNLTANGGIKAGNSYTVNGAGQIGWTSRGVISSPATGQIQIGAANAASPVAQTISTQGTVGGTTSNGAGANLTIQSGAGTGNAAPSSVIIQSPVATTSGTTQQTFEAEATFKGGLTVGAASGGAQGVGTVNATGFSVNGVSTSVVSASTATATGGTTATTIAALIARTLDIRDFGAVCNGTTDDHAAWQAMINAALAATTVSGTPLSQKMNASNCQSKVTTTLNMTGFTSFGTPVALATVVDMSGGCIIGSTNGNPVIELLASRFIRFQNLCIYGLSAGVATVASVAITGTAGQFSCTCTNLTTNQTLTISGTLGGSGTITGYTNPTTYLVSATNGTSTFTLQTQAGAAIVTTTGTPTGLTYAATSLPSWGITFGRVGASQSADTFVFDHPVIYGSYTFAPMYNLASESNVYIDPFLSNTLTTSNTYAYVGDGNNHFNITPVYATQTIAADTSLSNTSNTFLNGTFDSGANSNSAIWLLNTGSWRFIDSYIGTGSTHGVALYDESLGQNVDLYADIHMETTSLTSCFWLTGSNTGPALINFTYIDRYPECQTQIFGQDTGVSSVFLQGGTVKLPVIQHGNSVKIFQTPANWLVTGEFYIPNSANWSAAPFLMNGTINTNGNIQFYVPTLNPSNQQGSAAANAVKVAGSLVSTATKFTVSGCGTIATSAGGAESGSFTCATGASPATLVITINGGTGVAAPTGWSCFGSDETAGIGLVQTAHTTTSCTLKGNITTADVVVWGVGRGF